MTMSISRKGFCLILAGIAILLGILGYGTAAYEWSLGVNNTYWAHESALLFGLVYEGNIPSWYSAMLLFTAAAFAAVVSFGVEKDKFFWRLLACVLLYMSIDEAAAIHETLTIPLRESFHLEGFLFFGWILVGVPIAIIVALIFVPFWLRLPRYCQISFVLGAIVYLTGAVVIESYSATLFAVEEYATLPYDAISTVEEVMEMLGVIIVINALLWYLQTQIGEIKMTVE